MNVDFVLICTVWWNKFGFYKAVVWESDQFFRAFSDNCTRVYHEAFEMSPVFTGLSVACFCSEKTCLLASFGKTLTNQEGVKCVVCLEKLWQCWKEVTEKSWNVAAEPRREPFKRFYLIFLDCLTFALFFLPVWGERESRAIYWDWNWSSGETLASAAPPAVPIHHIYSQQTHSERSREGIQVQRVCVLVNNSAGMCAHSVHVWNPWFPVFIPFWLS